MLIRTILFAAIVAGNWSAPAKAQIVDGPASACRNVRAAPFLGWDTPIAVQAATDTADAVDARLTVGEAADMTLRSTSQVRYPATPERLGEDASHGGLALLSIETDGVYRVALGSGAWVDIVRDGETIVSTAHGHGPACSGIRKTVDFALTRGVYVVQIAGAPSARIEIMIAPSAN